MFRQSFIQTYCQFLLIIVFTLTMTACSALTEREDKNVALTKEIVQLSQQVKKLQAQIDTRDAVAAARPVQQSAPPDSFKSSTGKMTPEQYTKTLQQKISQQSQNTQSPQAQPQQHQDQPTVALSVDLKNPLAGLSQQELLEELIRRNRDLKNPAMQKAMVAAAFSLADKNQEMDWATANNLSPNQRQMMERYHTMLLSMYSQAAKTTYKFDRSELDAQLDEMFGNQPLNISTTALIYSVDSFGVYTPMEGNTFLAGKDNRIGLYCELENYKINRTSDDKFVVNLKQDIELYDSTGYAVWTQDSKRIKDVSRNRRKDFFTAMGITLPARLGVGTFRLKVRITDENNDAVAETSIPINFVGNIKSKP